MRARSRRLHHAGFAFEAPAQAPTPSLSSSRSSGSSTDDGAQRLEPAAQDVFGIARGLDREPAVPFEHRRGPAARELGEPFAPTARPSSGRDVPHPEQRLVHLLGVARVRATPPRARARWPRDRARPARRRSSRRACGAPAPPACGAPRAARRRGTCRAGPRGSRARTPTARACRPRRVRCCRRAARAALRGSPSMSIASVRQSSIVWRTIG